RRQRVVDEREVGIEQVEDTAILVNDGSEEQLRLAHYRRPQGVVELREEVAVRRQRLEVAGLQPLRSEILGEGPGLAVVEHATHLRLQVLAERPTVGQRE